MSITKVIAAFYSKSYLEHASLRILLLVLRGDIGGCQWPKAAETVVQDTAPGKTSSLGCFFEGDPAGSCKLHLQVELLSSLEQLRYVRNSCYAYVHHGGFVDSLEHCLTKLNFVLQALVELLPGVRQTGLGGYCGAPAKRDRDDSLGGGAQLPAECRE